MHVVVPPSTTMWLWLADNKNHEVRPLYCLQWSCTINLSQWQKTVQPSNYASGLKNELLLHIKELDLSETELPRLLCMIAVVRKQLHKN